MDSGFTATCNNTLDDFEIRRISFKEGDLTKFRAVYPNGDIDRLISPDEINAGLAVIHEADINLTLINTLRFDIPLYPE